MSVVRTQFSWMTDEEILTQVRSNDLQTDLELELTARLEHALQMLDDLTQEKDEVVEQLDQALHGVGA